MSSTHPPLESLLKLSQNCLEGFELSRLNRIANLRKEFREILDEWIELEIEARFARWVLEYRGGRDLAARQSALPAFVPSQLSCGGSTHAAVPFLLSSSDELPIEFPLASTAHFGESADCESRSPLRRLPVSQDAAAALRSLEHFACCRARAIGDQPMELLDFHAPDLTPSGPLFPFPQSEPAPKLSDVSSQMTYALAATNQSTHCVVRHASTFLASNYAAVDEPGARSELNLLPPSRPRASRLSSQCTFAPRRSDREPRWPSPFQLSPSQSSLPRTALLLRN